MASANPAITILNFAGAPSVHRVPPVSSDGLATGQTDVDAHVHVVPRRSRDPPEPRGGIQWVTDDTPGWPKA